MHTVIQGFRARLANQPLLVFDFRALWRSALSARAPESQKLKVSVSQPGIKFLSHCPHFGTLSKMGESTQRWYHSWITVPINRKNLVRIIVTLIFTSCTNTDETAARLVKRRH